MRPLGRIVTVIEPFRTSSTRIAGFIAALILIAPCRPALPCIRPHNRAGSSLRLRQSHPPQSSAAPAAGSQQPQAQDLEAPTIKIEANEVDLVFTVTDKKGHFITGLNQSSFGLAG